MDLQSRVLEFYMIHRGHGPDSVEAAGYFNDEVEELFEALESYWSGGGDLDHLAKEIGDVAFTLVAIAESLGIEYEVACDIVADDNRVNKISTRSGKIKKRDGYEPPSMKAAIL